MLGHREGRQAQFGQLVPDLAREAALPGNALAALKGIALVHPAGHGIAQLLLVVGKIEIHICLLPPGRNWREAPNQPGEAQSRTPSRRGHGGVVLFREAKTVPG
ncbi:hypothetical protein SDC9_212100 [bioreactor metagenome]|uniref:Uncharacterized protein n=1 Tax=bioreactor metagenome TaxID=1076179 RepID=A0A645JKX3_9ZZZZ